MAAKRRLGWLGPAIVLLGLAAGSVGVWYMMHARPKAGAVIDTFVLDPHTKIVVRAEDGGDRSFVELRVDDDVKWQALVPHYAGKPGKPGVAWSQNAVSVRVIRDGKAEIFALSMNDASKLGGIHLASEHNGIDPDASGPLTMTDHLRSYELVAGDGWHQLLGIDLKLGTAIWKKELGPVPVTAGGVDGGLVWVEQDGKRRYFRVFNGAEDGTVGHVPKPL